MGAPLVTLSVIKAEEAPKQPEIPPKTKKGRTALPGYPLFAFDKEAIAQFPILVTRPDISGDTIQVTRTKFRRISIMSPNRTCHRNAEKSPLK